MLQHSFIAQTVIMSV